MNSLTTPVEYGIAHVPTFSLTKNASLNSDADVRILVVTFQDIVIPPGQKAIARCVAQCGEMPANEVCIISPHPRLLSITEDVHDNTPLSIRPSQHVLARWVPNPDIFMEHMIIRNAKTAKEKEKSAPPAMSGSQRARRERKIRHLDDRLKPLHKGMNDVITKGQTANCGLIVEFTSAGTLTHWSQLDGGKGHAHLDFHVTITNTSPVEMIVPGGQPIGEATTSPYEDPQRNITQMTTTVDSVTARVMVMVGQMTQCDVDGMSALLTQIPSKGHVMNQKLERYLRIQETSQVVWPRVTDVKRALRCPDAVVNSNTIVGMVKVQRAVLTEQLMALIHTTSDHHIPKWGQDLNEEIYGKSKHQWAEVDRQYRKLQSNNRGDVGRYRFVLQLHKLLYRFPGLTIAVLADMMNRTDTRPYLEEMLHSCAHPSADNHLTKEIQLCNGENLLIIERWTENKARAIRATPIEDAQLLMDFEFPLYKTDGSRLRYTSQTQDRLDMDLYNKGKNDLDSDSDKYIHQVYLKKPRS
jgi:hypothetical protein